MQIVTLYILTALIFLILDGLMLTFHMQPLFRRHLGDQLLPTIRYFPAAAFYAAYIAGLLYLISLPALKSDTPILLPAMILGAMAYGTYEFTSYAIMKAWSLEMVATDVIWGSLLTAISAWGGVALTKMIFKGTQ
ncbi:DUF2177 family protein [Cypionkella sp.]|uniref:DUF2177 family protein n=1 Tax=Cypionkella sp. TaxID=2811411 RepID=UPI00261AEA26|nr:DUF2177 family protein [Cypionkella sp.]MDB5664082.1 hypothetical protein [Cypionkella sp.]